MVANKAASNKAASDLGQLALRRPLSAADRSPGCPSLRPAAAKQPVGRRWHPGHICGAWYRRRQRTGSGSASPSCASAAPRRRCPPSPSPSPSPASASCAGARGCRRCPRSGSASPCCHEPPRRRARVREGRFDRGGTADRNQTTKKTCGLSELRRGPCGWPITYVVVNYWLSHPRTVAAAGRSL